MFSPFFAEETGHAVPAQDEQASTSTGEPASAAANPLLNLWSVATAVTNTVKARADELVKSVVDTDWRSELSHFGREVGEESKTLKDKTAELVEHLPEQVVQAEEALHHLPAQVSLPKDVGQTLEGVGVAFAQLGKTLLQGTKELIDELKEGVETEIAAATKEGKRAGRAKSAAASAVGRASAVQAKYSRYEAEVAAMQRDSSTYCDEPEDAEEYARWKAAFSLTGVQADIGRITADNAFMAELQSRLVPIIVEHEDFWSRYFYRLHKLQQKEEQRQQLAQRAKTLQEDDVPLGWGDEDEAPPPAPSGAGATKELAGPSTSSPPRPKAVPAPEPATPTAQPRSASSGSAAAERAEGMPAPSAPSAASPAAMMAEQVHSSGGAGATAAAAAVALAADVAAGPAPVSPSESPESPAGRTESRVVSASPSGGGASASSSNVEHVDAELGQHESEPHAETASDSSAREWCVVSSDAKASTSAAPGAADAVASPRLPVSSGVSSGGAAEAASPSAAAAAEAPVAGREIPAAAAETTPASRPEDAAADANPVAAAPRQPAARSSAAKAPGKAGDEEEVDEDWGNWD